MDDASTRMEQALEGLRTAGELMQALAETAREAAESFLALHEELRAEHEEGAADDTSYPGPGDYDDWPGEDYEEGTVPFWADRD